MNSRKYTRGDLKVLLNALSEHLEGEQLDLYVYGSAACMLNPELDDAFGPDVFAQDIDAYSTHSDAVPLMRRARLEIHKALNLNHACWLSPNVVSMGKMVPKVDRYFKRVLRELDSKGLRVHLLKPEPQLAISLKRNMPEPHHIEQVSKLAKHLDIRHKDGLMDVWVRHANVVDIDDERKKDVARRIIAGRTWALDL